jgi:DNA-binding MarR family transcriptional regulator
MTDVSAGGRSAAVDSQTGGGGSETGIADRDRLIAYVELLFFAYRDFTGEPDAVLAEFGFGRAHHRVLHFVHRRPGLRVADLLDILKITKQSLARVLKQLVDNGFIVQQAGEADRRERLLFATAKGSRLAETLAGLQVKRIAAALAQAGPDAEHVTRHFLAGMISETERQRVSALIQEPTARSQRSEEER